MEIDTKTKDKIITYYKEVSEDHDIELEAIVRQERENDPFGQKVSKQQFASVVKYFRSIELEHLFHDDVLSVIFKYKNKEYRYEIIGKNNISEYCKSNNIRSITEANLISKSWVTGRLPIYIPDYHTKINLKYEREVEKEVVDEIKKNLYTLSKRFRFKKRFSFYSQDGLFRYDLTIVKSSKTDAMNMIASGIMSNPEKYEIEIEFLKPNNKTWPSEDEFVKKFFSHIGVVLRVLDNEDYLISSKKKEKVLENYATLCDFKYFKENFKNKRTKFIGPMPVTFELKNLRKPDLGVISIREDYTVTDKADGERQLLFFDKDGKAYMIDRNLNVKYTGIYNESYANTLLDGEYITRDKYKNGMKLYMGFDIYYLKTKNVCHLPLMSGTTPETRLEKLKQVCNSSFSGDRDFKIEAKQFYGDDIFTDAHKILSRFELSNASYEIDGLIYTPKNLGVGEIQDAEERYQGGTWDRVLKWKEVNTIDFRVETEKNDSNSDIVIEKEGQLFKVLNLYVGYSMKLEKITPYRYLTEIEKEVLARNQRKRPGRGKDAYVNRLFIPPDEEFDNISKAFIKVDDTKSMKAENGDVIYDNNVVEFHWTSEGWAPLLVRKDKTWGNDYSSALNVWRSIKNQVTPAMITDASYAHVDDVDWSDPDMYYNRRGSDVKVASRAMIDFHNHWVKGKSLIEKFKGKTTSVFDIACGKANDLNRYFGAGIRTIVGVDISEDNITNPKDGAYARLSEKQLRESDVICFLPMDFSQTINEQYISAITDENTREVVNIIWGKASNPALTKFHNLVGKFDMVSCQFAIHYFFQNATKLNALIGNIDAMLKNGGYFIGTCLDGLSVHNAIVKNMEEGKGNSITGYAKDKKRVMWEIQKMYDTFHNESDKNYGLTIKVFIETINRPIDEYLVDFSLLTNALKKFNIRHLTLKECEELGLPSSSGTFEGLYNGFHQRDDFKNNIKMDKDAQTYSFMNRWFVFKKDVQTTEDNVPRKKKK
jgi:hypothetical protein